MISTTGSSNAAVKDTLASPYDFFERYESGERRAVEVGNSDDVYGEGDLMCGFVDLSQGVEGELVALRGEVLARVEAAAGAGTGANATS